MFGGTGFSNKIFEKNFFLTMHLFFILFSLQFHEAPTVFGLKMFQTVNKCTFCEHSLLSISKLTYFKSKTINAVFNVN